MKTPILLSLALIMLSMQVYVAAQDVSERDSLRSIAFDKSLPDTVRLEASAGFTWSFVFEIPDSLLYYAQMFFKESERADYMPGMIRSRIHEGYYYAVIGKPDEAMDRFLAALDLAGKLGDPGLLGEAYTSVAQGYLGSREYDKMSEYLLQALKIFRETHNLEQEIATMGSLAYVYSRTGNSPKAMEMYLRVLAMADSAKIGEKDIKPDALYRIGQIYMTAGRSREGIRSYYEALKLYEQYNNVVISHHILYNLAYCFLDDTLNLYGEEIGDNRRSVDIALDYSEELQSWFGQMEDSATLSECYLLDAKAFLIKGDKKKALEKLQKAEELESVHRDFEHRIFFIESIAQIYEAMGDYHQAMKHYKKVIALEIEAKEVEVVAKVSELTESFEIEQMEDQLTFKEQQLAKNRVITYLFIGISALILLLAGVVFYFLRQKQKAARLLEQQNREIEKARLRAEQSEKFKERFLASMSHEIRTPLNAVIGMTDLLLDDPQPPKTGTFLRNIKQAGEHLTGIINQILDLSRIDAGKLDLHESPFKLKELMEELKNLLGGKASEKGIQLIIQDGEGTPEWLRGDAGRIRQVLLNLAGNAIKFTERGSIQVKIAAGEISDGKAMVHFSVEDTGVGIPRELQAVIFEEFVQAGESEDQRVVGTGLGLSISKKLVERMGGTLALESEPQKGSVFSFTLPLALSTEEAYRALEKEKDMSELFMKGSFRILVVEDNPSNQIVTEGLLEKILPESKVILVEDGYKALARLEKEKFDLVLMDIRMPGIDGYETTRRLRLLGNENAAIPVIALTASVVRSDIQHCLESGMNGYVPKPVSQNVLARTLHEHLKRVTDQGVITQEPDKENFLAAISNRPAWSDRLYDTCNGKKDRFIRYLELFLAQSGEQVGKWQVWMDQLQHEPLAFSIHSLVPHLREFLDEKSAATAVVLDQELRKGWSESHTANILSLKEKILKLHREASELLKVLS
ncbi:MAG TPA: ATP-binding protein [Bacteroidales bacterium]|nr:ATP-binding protein [Bacteroidales bacterium]HNS46157.1 ATP-binding protein [Bacteroidales bacterium]